MTSRVLLVVAIFTLTLIVLQKRGWINLFNKEKPSMGNVLGVFDEIFSPSKHQAIIELKDQKERKIETEISDPNKIHIELKSR